MDGIVPLARMLGLSEEMLMRVDDHLSRAFNKTAVLKEVMRENEEKIHERLDRLGVKQFRSNVVEEALARKIRRDDHALAEYFGFPTCDSEENCKDVLRAAHELADIPKGFFLKKEKARELLEREPPKKILGFFHASSARELLSRVDLFAVYSALRFIEDKEWLNRVFFKQIEYVTPSDFEEREIELHVLGNEWIGIKQEAFLKKKFHNVSHLKELGFIFVIPLPVDTPGEMTRLFGLLMHYLHEITFYSALFRLYAKEKDTFAENLVSALRGDVLDGVFPKAEQPSHWMMIQQYLAKEDKNDPRLFAPHVNPEAIHWMRAGNDISRFGRREKNLDTEFWHDLDWVGTHIPNILGGETFVSFNLFDNAMTLVNEKRIVTYRYHQHEALWNKIFSMYAGFDRMEELIVKNFRKGYIQI